MEPPPPVGMPAYRPRHAIRGERQRVGDEGPRLELTLTQAAYAVPVGAALGGQSSAQAGLLGAVAAGSIAGAVSWSVGKDMTSGQVQTVDSVAPWMLWHGGALAFVDPVVGGAVAGGGFLLAPLIGGLLATQQPDAGTVGLANSAGVWTIVALALSRNALRPSDTSHFVARDRFDAPGMVAMLVAGDLAIVGGALLGHELHPTRGQAFALDGCALLGLVTGALFGVGMRESSDQAVSQASTVGLLAGVAGGLALLWNDDQSLPELPVAKLPLPTLQVGAQGTWTLGWQGRF